MYPIIAAYPHHISIIGRPRGNDWLCDEIRALSAEGIDTVVSMLIDEETQELGLAEEPMECSAMGIKFVNLAVPDRSVPLDRNAFLSSVEDLVELVRGGHHLAVHCRASIGRSSLLAASILIRMGWNANAAFEAIQIARGCSVPDTPEQRGWVASNIVTSQLPAPAQHPQKRKPYAS